MTTDQRVRELERRHAATSDPVDAEALDRELLRCGRLPAPFDPPRLEAFLAAYQERVLDHDAGSRLRWLTVLSQRDAAPALARVRPEVSGARVRLHVDLVVGTLVAHAFSAVEVGRWSGAIYRGATTEVLGCLKLPPMMGLGDLVHLDGAESERPLRDAAAQEVLDRLWAREARASSLREPKRVPGAQLVVRLEEPDGAWWLDQKHGRTA